MKLTTLKTFYLPKNEVVNRKVAEGASKKVSKNAIKLKKSPL